jgi:hypothetical protein
MHSALSSSSLDRNQKAGLELVAIGTDCVDFVRGVGGSDMSIPASTTGCEVDGHDVTLPISPFALDAEKLSTDTEQ